MVWSTHKTGPYEVKAPQTPHDALDVVGGPEKALLPARLPLDFSLNARLHAVQNTGHCRENAGPQCCYIIRHLLHITLYVDQHVSDVSTSASSVTLVVSISIHPVCQSVLHSCIISQFRHIARKHAQLC